MLLLVFNLLFFNAAENITQLIIWLIYFLNLFIFCVAYLQVAPSKSALL